MGAGLCYTFHKIHTGEAYGGGTRNAESAQPLRPLRRAPFYHLDHTGVTSMRFHSFEEMLRHWAGRKDGPALFFEGRGGKESWTYAELLAAVEARAAALRAGGKTCIGVRLPCVLLHRK